MCQVNKVSLTLDKLQLSGESLCKLCGVQLLIIHPSWHGVGVGTSYIWAVDQTLHPGESLAMRDYILCQHMYIQAAYTLEMSWGSV